MPKDGYPLDYELERIKSWDIPKDGVKGLLDLIEECWWCPEWGFHKRNGFTQHFKKSCIKLELHTAGWSGNESIISALQNNFMFWTLYWVESHRGGHYWFEVPLSKENKK